ncbi:ImmA/IrrE family metallo-endopeptidase [Enterococcus sp. 669A]|uniref:ImmA/IrrE family metallo-endopeptidase n=1 Tax=Candidatus Enterococcus moelleringii TaxID=2815325 RepID=A0ABS3L6P7_9ENTE|nr:ImmA/IrrE family metallo-endopeptidase [Enterococcus sp. 669A]MBO1305288.1 ImmA/IrrE family metallo-endopeptidase [Enterococcus sp. 669A]
MAKGITVKPIIIQWAIQNSGKSMSLISQKFSKIDEWASTESELSVNELNKLSKELRVPFGYFFLKKPPVEDIELLKYRTIDNEEHETPSRELIDTIKHMEARQSFMRENLVEDGFLPLNFVGSATTNEEAEELATAILTELGLTSDWNQKNPDTFNTLRQAASNAGILVMQNGVVGNNNYRPLDVAEFRAFVLIDEYAPLIFLNARDSVKAKIFSLCHELVHIWLGVNELYNDPQGENQVFLNEQLEKFCNETAAEMLLPGNVLREIYDVEMNAYENIKSISKGFSVSDLVACIRLRQQKLISKKIFDEVYPTLLEEMRKNLSAKEEMEKSSGGNYYYTQGSRLDKNFVHSVSRKAREGKILYTEAYELLGAKGKTYDKLIEFVEGR